MAYGTARIGRDKYRTEISVGGRDIIADEPPALGGQGTPEAIIKECINNGIAKINVNTEISVHTVNGVRSILANNEKVHLSKLCLDEIVYIKEIVKKYMQFFKNV